MTNPKRNCLACVNSCGNSEAYMFNGQQYSTGWADCYNCSGTGVAGTKAVTLSPDAQRLLATLLESPGVRIAQANNPGLAELVSIVNKCA